jgi:acetate kinase
MRAVFTAGIGEHSAVIRAPICEASSWLGIELDPVANERHRPRISTPSEPRLRLGHSDERGADDRAAVSI